MSGDDHQELLPVDLESVKRLLSSSPFHEFLQLELGKLDAADGLIEIRMKHHEGLNRLPTGSQFHGGVLASLVDIAATFAVVVKLRKPVPTVDLRLDYVRPASGGILTARGIVRRAGRSLSTADVEVTDEGGKLLAMGRGTFLTG